MRIAAVGRALPPNYYDQDALLAGFRRYWAHAQRQWDRLEALHRNVTVAGRHLALPMERYLTLSGWGEANDEWIRVGLDVGEQAVRRALDRAGIAPDEVGAILFVSVTGIATPSIDARLVNRLGINRHVRRLPIFGLGCVAGAAGIARAADYVRAYPDQHALLLSVELCSLTLQRGDLTVANLIASGLFGDGAAAVVVSGDAAQGHVPPRGPTIVDTRSVFYPETEHLMGWDIGEHGFKIVLSADVPDIVRGHLRADIDAFLGEHGLARRDIARWICHPGGPKVLQAFQQALELPEGALDLTWNSLRTVGNLSSASVLFVLEDTLADPPPAGSYGLLLAMGPGFCSELVLLRFE